MDQAFDSLVEAYLHGVPTAEQCRELDAVLCANRDARRAFLFAALVETDLPGILTEAPVRVADEVWMALRRRVGVPAYPLPAGARLGESVAARFSWRRVAWSSAIAACIGAFVAYSVWQGMAHLTPAVSTATMAAKVTHVHGEVSLTSLERAGVTPVKVGTRILPGHIVRSGPNGKLTLRYQDGSVIQMMEASKITTAAGTRIKSVYLEQGKILAHMVPNDSGRKIVFSTPHAVVRVVGTQFVLTADDKRSRVEVEQGKVALTSKESNETVMVGEKQSVVVGEGHPLRPGISMVSADGKSKLHLVPAVAAAKSGDGAAADPAGQSAAPATNPAVERVYEYLGETAMTSPCGLYRYYSVRVRDPATGKAGAVVSGQGLGSRIKSGTLIRVTLQKAYGAYWVRSCRLEGGADAGTARKAGGADVDAAGDRHGVQGGE